MVTGVSTTGPKNADNEPEDQFGYACYTIVLPAGDRITEAQQAIWRRYPSPRAAIPAHVTVKGTFVGIGSLDEVKSLIGEIAGSTAPFHLEAASVCRAHPARHSGSIARC